MILIEVQNSYPASYVVNVPLNRTITGDIYSLIDALYSDSDIEDVIECSGSDIEDIVECQTDDEMVGEYTLTIVNSANYEELNFNVVPLYKNRMYASFSIEFATKPTTGQYQVFLHDADGTIYGHCLMRIEEVFDDYNTYTPNRNITEYNPTRG